MADDESLTSGMGFELLAASLRSDAGDTGAFLEALATKLGGALPHRVRVERGGGLFSHQHPVRRLAANLGEWEYVVEAAQGGLAAARTHTVRGISLKSEPLGLDAWIEELAAELAALAQRSAQDRAALQRLLT
ncbi:MAG TPA: hypothetical protein VGN32_13615 [Ktedonobacterales bacterium]|jgi:hypothetical protein|nr:hypothetical protein [Ktedonobacterales bacterium]